jgi:hypothetical protein
MRLEVSMTAGKPEMMGRKRSWTSHTSSAVSSGLRRPRLGAPPLDAMDEPAQRVQNKDAMTGQ